MGESLEAHGPAKLLYTVATNRDLVSNSENQELRLSSGPTQAHHGTCVSTSIYVNTHTQRERERERETKE